MRTGTHLLLSAALAAAVLCLARPVPAAGIEAVRGKKYAVTRQHGPWMIMVASFKAPPEGMRTEGMSPEEAAGELVYELRRKGIPAYTMASTGQWGQVDASDRLTAFAAAQAGLDDAPTRARYYAASRGNVCVLAGNYDDPQGDVAQKTLKYVKDFYPDFLKDEDPNVAARGSSLIKLKNGGVWRRTPGQPAPLGGAFLTTNPLLKPEEVKGRQRDPLLLKLNANSEFALHNNPGKYTVVVATFRGGSALLGSQDAPVGANFRGGNALLHGDSEDSLAARTLQMLDVKTAAERLDDAAMNAWELCKALRTGGGGREPMQAWVWHDRNQSVVTVGSFSNPKDPKIAEIQKMFGAKVVSGPQTGNRPVLIAEPMDLKGKDGKTLKWWMFDPKPQLIAVPALR